MYSQRFKKELDSDKNLLQVKHNFGIQLLNELKKENFEKIILNILENIYTLVTAFCERLVHFNSVSTSRLAAY